MTATAPSETRYRVSGMDCVACATEFETAVRRLPGVEDVSVSVPNGKQTVSLGDALGADAIVGQVRNLGYGISQETMGPSSRMILPPVSTRTIMQRKARGGRRPRPS